MNALSASLQQFIDTHGELDNYTGTVASIDYKNYNLGNGVNLGIALPCGATVFVRFLDVTNPGWGQFDPTQFAQLSVWRPTLENLSNGDAVMFSARILPATGAPYTFPPPGSALSLSALISNLNKR